MADINLPPEGKKIIDVLMSNGFKAYAVGGCVRDYVMGFVPSDYDITTDAQPDDVKSLFKDAKIIETGIKHGTVTVIRNGFTAEITTFRVDGNYRDSRHPDNVRFCTSLKEDLKRRDFTINAIAYNHKEGLVDYFGGTDDIASHTIRCVGEATLRFKEDALRILRALRFSSTLNFNIAKETKEAILATYPLLENISAERILDELKKLLDGKNVYRVLTEYEEVFRFLVNPAPNGKQYKDMCVLVDKSPKELRMEAFFLFCTPEEAKEKLRNLKADNRTVNSVTEVINAFPKEGNLDEYAILKLLNRHGETALTKALCLKEIHCEITGNSQKEVAHTRKLLEEIIQSKKCYKVSHLNIRGADFAEHKIAEGKIIGETLNHLLCMVMENKISNTKDALIKAAQDYILKR